MESLINCKNMKTPLVIIIYNRHKYTYSLIESIKHVKPNNIFVIADGPKRNNVNDKIKCDKTRRIIDKVNWTENITKIYSEINLGLENRIVTGLDFVFSKVDRAIILEDDCIPNRTFFAYCSELLDKYENNLTISHIGGSRFIDTDDTNDSYYFSKYSIEWGWATWKNRWLRYDGEMSDWPLIKKNKNYIDLFNNKKTEKYWNWIFENCYNGNINSWAYKWKYKNISQNKLSIIPNKNLINNIGIGYNSTNTKLKNRYFPQNSFDIKLPLIHPTDIQTNHINDERQEYILYNKSVLWLELFTKRLKPLLNKLKL